MLTDVLSMLAPQNRRLFKLNILTQTANDEFLLEHFSGTEELAHKTCLSRTVPKNGLHFNSLIHVHKSPSFGNCGFLWVELNFDELHFFSFDEVVDFVVATHDFFL